jgi:hypothetical protein
MMKAGLAALTRWLEPFLKAFLTAVGYIPVQEKSSKKTWRVRCIGLSVAMRVRGKGKGEKQGSLWVKQRELKDHRKCTWS